MHLLNVKKTTAKHCQESCRIVFIRSGPPDIEPRVLKKLEAKDMEMQRAAAKEDMYR